MIDEDEEDEGRAPTIKATGDTPVQKVKSLLCYGLDRLAILSYASQDGWESAPEDVDEWISDAMIQLAEDASAIDTQVELGKSITRLNYLYLEASKAKAVKTALSIQREINRMLKLKLATERRGVAQSQPAAEKCRLTIAK